MGKSVKVYVGAVFFTIVQIFVACIIPYLIYRSFNFEGADVFDMLGAQSSVNMVSAFIPLPGRQAVQKEVSIYSSAHFLVI